MAFAAQGVQELIGNDRTLGSWQVVDCVMNTIPIARNLEHKKGGIRWTRTSQQGI